MILINKKRIGFILTCVLLGLFTFSFQVANKQTNISEKISKETTAIPSSGKVIIVDAGHGKPDERS